MFCVWCRVYVERPLVPHQRRGERGTRPCRTYTSKRILISFNYVADRQVWAWRSHYNCRRPLLCDSPLSHQSVVEYFNYQFHVSCVPNMLPIMRCSTTTIVHAVYCYVKCQWLIIYSQQSLVRSFNWNCNCWNFDYLTEMNGDTVNEFWRGYFISHFLTTKIDCVFLLYKFPPTCHASVCSKHK